MRRYQVAQNENRNTQPVYIMTAGPGPTLQVEQIRLQPKPQVTVPMLSMQRICNVVKTQQ